MACLKESYKCIRKNSNFGEETGFDGQCASGVQSSKIIMREASSMKPPSSSSSSSKKTGDRIKSETSYGKKLKAVGVQKQLKLSNASIGMRYARILSKIKSVLASWRQCQSRRIIDVYSLNSIISVSTTPNLKGLYGGWLHVMKFASWYFGGEARRGGWHGRNAPE